MAGYNWGAGKSNNAVNAEKKGLMVASKLAKRLRRFKKFKGCKASDIANSMEAAEWHHSSKFYNKTNYYSPADLLELTTRTELQKSILDRKNILVKNVVICKRCNATNTAHSANIEAKFPKINKKCSVWNCEGVTSMFRMTGEQIERHKLSYAFNRCNNCNHQNLKSHIDEPCECGGSYVPEF